MGEEIAAEEMVVKNYTANSKLTVSWGEADRESWPLRCEMLTGFLIRNLGVGWFSPDRELVKESRKWNH